VAVSVRELLQGLLDQTFDVVLQLSHRWAYLIRAQVFLNCQRPPQKNSRWPCFQCLPPEWSPAVNPVVVQLCCCELVFPRTIDTLLTVERRPNSADQKRMPEPHRDGSAWVQHLNFDTRPPQFSDT